MIIEKKKISDLKPAPYNPRKSNEKQEANLKKSLEKFGVVEPIVFNKRTGYIVGGHFRIRELKKLGYKEVDCVIVDLNEDDEKELNIRLNANTGEWDYDKLANNWNLEQLEDWGLEMLGWEAESPEAVEDDYEIPATIETDIVLGDLFEIGEHRLLCGDSTDSDQVAKLMNGEKADICFTSPPYWVGFAYENEDEKATILQHIYDASVNMVLFVKGKIIINTGNISSITTAEKITGKKQPALLIDWWIDALNKNNYLLRHIRIWAKNGGVQPSRANDKIDMHWEYMGLFTDEDGNAGFISTFKNQNDKEGIAKNTPTWAVNGIWNDIQGKARASGHVAAFPVQLVNRYAQMYTKKNHLFYEPYCGSGTTMVAAHQLKRKCYGMELDPKYCQVIVDRMRKLDPTLVIKKNGKML